MSLAALGVAGYLAFFAWIMSPSAELTERPFFPVWRDAYRRAGWSGTLANKRANLAALVAFRADDVLGERWDARAAAFFHLLPCLGVLLSGVLVAPFHLLRRGEINCHAREGWCLVVLSLLFWCAAMFGPGTTLVHQGPYATVLLLMLLSVHALQGISRWLCVTVCALQAAWTAWLYAPALRVSPEGVTLPLGPLQPSMLFVFFAGVSLAVYLLRRLTRSANVLA